MKELTAENTEIKKEKKYSKKLPEYTKEEKKDIVDNMTAIIDAPILDDKKENPKPIESKIVKDNSWIWGLVAVALLPVIFYLKNKRDNERVN